MVLNLAMKFEKLFSGKDGSHMSKMQWDSVDRLEDFTIRIKDGADALRNLNRQLRIAHASVCEIVISMGEVNLLRQRDLWKQKI